jgi:hypothetical protein
MNLRIGQRVKKVRGPNNVGVTGVVIGTDLDIRKGGRYITHDGREFTADHDCDIKVRVDAPVRGATGRTLPAGSKVGASSDFWEPILPEGAAPSEFTTLADLLNGLKVTA